MKNFLRMLALAAPLGVAMAACHKKADVKSSVAELEKAFPSAVAQAAAQPQAQPAAPAPVPQTGVNDLVKSAIAAAQANDYAGGVIALQAAQQRPGMSADQVMAAQRAKQAMIQELQRRAVNGDQQALAQLKAIEKTRSQ
jgi:hypothetical protein